MIQLILLGHDIFKFDDQSGRVWMIRDDEDDTPEWIEILDRKDKKEKHDA